MINLRDQELKELIHIGNVAQQCENLLELQSNSLQYLRRYIEADSSVFYYINQDNNRIRFSEGLSYGVPKDAPKEWREHYQDVDPFVNRFLSGLKSSHSRVVISSEVINRDFVRTEFYYEFLKPQAIYHVLAAGIMEGDRPIALLGFHRPKNARPFTEREVTKVNLTLPHLTAAAQRIKLSEMISEREWILERLQSDLDYQGVIILDDTMSPVFINEFARELFGIRYSGCSTGNLHINRILPEEIYCNCLQLRNSSSLDERDNRTNFKICNNLGEISGYIRIYNQSPGKSNFLVCFGVTTKDSINLKGVSRYGLSNRETDIVRLVAEGFSNKEVAEKLFISFRTVENHLRSIYKKMEIHNRTSLVSRLVTP